VQYSKKVAPKKSNQKSANTSKGDGSKDNIGSDSDLDAAKPTVRKLTRSASTRKSKHLTGKVASETDSDAESTKRSMSKSPVKKAPVATKGKTKNKRSDTKLNNNNVTPPAPTERKCPVPDCDSSGHLGGQFDKHFTQESCPVYHNVTAAQTKELYLERKKHEEERKKAIILLDPIKKIQTIEQKLYLQKIKDMRAKFKPQPTPSSSANQNNNFNNNTNNISNNNSILNNDNDSNNNINNDTNNINSSNNNSINNSSITTSATTTTSNNNDKNNDNYHNNNSKSKNNANSNNNNNINKDNSKDNINKGKEPNLNGMVSDYDLQLFREAQAIASENMENELKTLPASKGTK